MDQSDKKQAFGFFICNHTGFVSGCLFPSIYSHLKEEKQSIIIIPAYTILLIIITNIKLLFLYCFNKRMITMFLNLLKIATRTHNN